MQTLVDAAARLSWHAPEWLFTRLADALVRHAMDLDLLERGGVIAGDDSVTVLVPHTRLDPSSAATRYWRMWVGEAFNHLN